MIAEGTSGMQGIHRHVFAHPWLGALQAIGVAEAAGSSPKAGQTASPAL